MRNRIIYALSYIFLLTGSYLSLLVLKPEKTLGEVYRIFFFHFPLAIVSYLAFAVGLVLSIAYLRSKKMRFDDLASSSIEIGLLFCVLATITGAIFSKQAWGAYWSWDPRQTTTLIVCFIYASYLALRSAIEDRETKARLSAIFGIFAFFSVPLSYLSTRLWFSLHPTMITSKGMKLEKDMRIALLVMVIGMLFLYVGLLSLSSRIKKLEREGKTFYTKS